MYLFGTECIGSAVIYWAIFWKLFKKSELIGKTPKDCLSIATNTISTIHSLLSLPALFDFFYHQRWNAPLIDEPGLSGHIWAIGNGYLISDLFAHFACFMFYDKSIIPRRWDSIAHHIISLGYWFICQWPTFKNAWAIFSSMYAIELSTIFLNTQWFGKHFKMKKLEKVSKILFVITWFLVRVPVLTYVMVWLFQKFEEMRDNPEFPLRALVYLIIGAVPMIPLQIVWTLFIAWKTIRACLMKGGVKMASKPPGPGHMHGVSMEIQVQKIADLK